MRKTILLLLSIVALSATAQTRYTQYVDQRIGTGDHGHVFVGANVPQGMVNVGPTQIETGWDWCSGYHESGDSIVGFSHLHLSGTGCGDLGDIALMPSTTVLEQSRVGMASSYRHETEEMQPGYYAVTLDRDGTRAEMTTTNRVALHRYTYTTADAILNIDLQNGVGDTPFQTRIYKLDDYTLAGFRASRGWANLQKVFFYMKFDQPIAKWNCNSLDSYYGSAHFNLKNDKQLKVKVALSPVSEMNAYHNMMAELPDWDFELTKQKALQTWDNELSRIEASFANERDARIFYTGMYHLLMAPQTWCDVQGDYYGSDGKVKHSASHINYTTWSLWDTYRAAHPLATIILRDRLTDYAKSMLQIWKEQKELPVWHLMSNETYCMVGCPAVPVLADMCLKGVEGIDYNEAFQAMKESLLKDNRSLNWMKSHGYIPYNKGDGEPVAKSLEYYLADWSAAQVAAKLGLKQDSTYFYNRSMGYKRLFDPVLRCMRALDTEGLFRSREGFNPSHQTSDYTEGNPWQYTWLVPHDVHGLINCFPTEQDFTNRLDSLFLASSELNAEANPDITGLIGQYAHGNEPSHHVLYLYNYVGQPWKGARRIRQVLSELYTDQSAGLCGNEDVGQMSAWYILSSLGFYQVAPCGGKYVIGSPIVREAKVRVADNKYFTIRVHSVSKASKPASAKEIYVDHILLNGEPYPYSYLMHDDIVKGGTIDFYMSAKPGKWGTKPEHRP
ncbi:MAG: GH92 family glycosyl hydrolase [Bacteroidales bacterium]|nr:GH92 family glycosyl hydrolase [Bacteroidales bacterium]